VQALNPTAQGLLQTLTAQSTLLMKMRILSFGKNYDVMDPQQRVLCQVGLPAGQNVKGQLIAGAVGGYLGRWAARSLEYTYDVKDPGGNLALQIRKGSGGNRSEFLVVDPATGAGLGTILMERSLIGGLKATWSGPDGQPWMHTEGNVIRLTYRIQAPDGRPLGHVKHKILAIRDVWELDLEPTANHLYSAIFAVILDFEKKM
jgi:uncharacterized protein YxjI